MQLMYTSSFSDETFAHHDMLEKEISRYCNHVSENETIRYVEDLEELPSRLVLVNSLHHLKWVRGWLIDTVR